MRTYAHTSQGKCHGNLTSLLLYKKHEGNPIHQDLSLLTHLSASEIQQLQSAQESRKDFILRDDADAVWKHLETLQDGKVDWALDNAGYEVSQFCVFPYHLAERNIFP